MWQKIKNLFSKSQQSFTTSSEQTIQGISKTTDEPVIKKLKREVSFRKDPKFREIHSSNG